MTKEEAIIRARAVAKEAGWGWSEPTYADRRKRWGLFGRCEWLVVSNANCRGGNARILLDDQSGQVLRKSFKAW